MYNFSKISSYVSKITMKPDDVIFTYVFGFLLTSLMVIYLYITKLRKK